MAANKIDLYQGAALDRALGPLRRHAEAAGVPLFPISAATGAGMPELIRAVARALEETGWGRAARWG